MHNHLGEALRLLRVFHDLSRHELENRLGISKSYLSEIEAGKKQPSLELIYKYAQLFRVPTSSILFFGESLDKGSGKKTRTNIASKVLKILDWIEERDRNGHAEAG